MNSRIGRNANDDLVTRLALRAIEVQGSCSNEIQRYCWMAVHEYLHGVMPVEYDIREIDEDLYVSVLELAKNIGSQ